MPGASGGSETTGEMFGMFTRFVSVFRCVWFTACAARAARAARLLLVLHEVDQEEKQSDSVIIHEPRK